MSTHSPLRLLPSLLLALAAGSGALQAQQPSRLVTVDTESRRIPAYKLFEKTHGRLLLTNDLERVAVGDEEIVSETILHNREVLLQAKKNGRTSVIVWFTDGSAEEFLVSVERDLTILKNALLDIHETITVEIAPDREAVVLRGTVPDIGHFLAAEDAARNYLNAGLDNSNEDSTFSSPLLQTDPTMIEDERDLQVSDERPSGSAIINLIRVEDLPLRKDTRIQEAIRAMGAPEIVVRRVLQGDTPNDDEDLYVLEGVVHDQTTLVRAITLASRIVDPSQTGEVSIEVLADESGSLPGSGSGGNSGSSQRGNFGSSQGSSSGFGSQNIGLQLFNAVKSNIGRAKVLAAANGRVLSFVDVKDLPQVRVSVRLFEINRTKLRDWDPQLSVTGGDFDTPSVDPLTDPSGVPTDTFPLDGNQDVQGVVSYIADGFAGELVYSGSHWAVDAAFNLLESQGLARILSEPSTVVLSGEQAFFQVGGSVPVPVSTTTPSSTTTDALVQTVEQQPFGVSLGIRPLVGEGDRITLDVLPQIVLPDADLTATLRDTTGTDPLTTAFESRSLVTTTRLDDRQSLILGGLVTRRQQDDVVQTPWFHRVPLLGWFFQSTSMNDQDSELVIIVTPAIVREPIAEASLWMYPTVGELLTAAGIRE